MIEETHPVVWRELLCASPLIAVTIAILLLFLLLYVLDYGLLRNATMRRKC